MGNPIQQLAVLKNHRCELIVGDFVVVCFQISVVVEDLVGFAVLACENLGAVGLSIHMNRPLVGSVPHYFHDHFIAHADGYFLCIGFILYS